MIIKKISVLMLFIILVIFSNLSTYCQPDTLVYTKKNFVHYAGLFLGLNSVFSDKIYSFALIANYEFKYSKNLGIGAFGQINIGKKPEFLVGMPLYIHKVFDSELNLFLAPGLCFTDNIKYVNPSNNEVYKELNLPYPNPYRRGNFFIRIGGSWNFPYKIEPDHKILIQPYLHFDWLNQEKIYVVIGVKGCYVFE